MNSVRVRRYVRRREVAVKRWSYPRGPYRKIKVFEFRSDREARNFARRELERARQGGDYHTKVKLLPKEKPKRRRR